MNRYWFTFWLGLAGLIIGFFYHFNWLAALMGMWQRHKLINFAENDVHAAIIIGDIGRGKTLLMSILARGIKHGIKKVGFINNIRDAEPLSYSDINIHESKYVRDTYNMPKYFFLDEGNLYIKGNDFRRNRVIHAGVSLFLAWSRHFGVRFWMTAQRSGQAWIEMREVVNYYVKLGERKHLFDWGEREYYILPVEFYTQSGILYKEFNITITNYDFGLYDSYWLRDIRHFLPIKPEAKHNRWIKK